MKFDISVLDGRGHLFIENVSNTGYTSCSYYQYICEKCNYEISQYCNGYAAELVWLACDINDDGKPYEDWNLLQEEVLTCDENIIKNIIE